MRIFVPILAACCIVSCSPSVDTSIPGLQEPVEIVRDPYGINHIYAQNEHDLFFAQGYAAAKDRLFQFEIWRRQATGTIAEILGPREVKRDIGSRLFKFRGDLKKEFSHYHPHGQEIITAFTEGVNAYIGQVQQDTSLLTLEFKLLGIKPQPWTPEIVISRHQGLLGNIQDEVNIGCAVALVGAEPVKEVQAFEPGTPDLSFAPGIRKELLLDSVTELYNAYRKKLLFLPEDLIAYANPDVKDAAKRNLQDIAAYVEIQASEKQTIGSNNWIVSGKLSQSGAPMLANDPHRAIAAPSLRYMVHLSAPGWNVVGGGEPTIPGVSIGHNDKGAWGLTIFAIDGEDLYVYELNPKNQRQYKYKGKWEDMRIESDTIKVKGSAPVIVEHAFTRHGPVTFTDAKNNVGYAIRCAWLEPGCAPYLASLRIDQATTWEEFREGCSYSRIPGENMIWADKSGNIGWQAVGIAPQRSWSGLLPVPGDGSHEWDGYLPIKSLPNVLNPEKGFWATANENNVPLDYDHRNAVGWLWADRSRVERIDEVLGSGKSHTMEDMMHLQVDYLSLPARTLVPLLNHVSSPDPRTEEIRKMLLKWNFVMDKNSVEATQYAAWQKIMSKALWTSQVPDLAKKYIRTVPLSKVIQWLTKPGKQFGKNPEKGRDEFLIHSLEQAASQLSTRLGDDMSHWQYGQASYHHVLIKHPLSNAVGDSLRKKLEAGPWPRGGNGSTPGMTTNSDNQTSGASFRMVTDVSDWDNAMFTNTPGQSGDPNSPYYKNLFELWANDQHFPVYFSRAKVDATAAEKVMLKPR